MSLATAELPSDLPALRAFALACQGELKAAELAVQSKALEIEKLKFQIAKLRRMQFGRSSERINHQIAQLELRLEELEAGMAEDATRAEAKAEPPNPRHRSASVASQSGGHCPIICRGKRSCISLLMTVRAPALIAAGEWPGSART